LQRCRAPLQPANEKGARCENGEITQKEAT
jgi:hypothetical protein